MRRDEDIRALSMREFMALKFPPLRAGTMAALRLLADCLRRGLHKQSYHSVRRYPYGRWMCADGRQVLFDRGYCPIWQWHPDDGASGADRNEWVKFTRAEHFFDDRTAWWRQYEGMKRLRSVLRELGQTR
jgi:hypothetical protein